MLEVRKSATAERDLIEIWQYGYLKWGLAQADRYIEAVEDAIGRLRRYPRSGEDAAHFRSGYRRRKSGVHHIYYRITGPRIEIMRVLSARQDPPRHLEG